MFVWNICCKLFILLQYLSVIYYVSNLWMCHGLIGWKIEFALRGRRKYFEKKKRLYFIRAFWSYIDLIMTLMIVLLLANYLDSS